MAKGEMSVEELVAKIQRGELVLPEIQRRYVWRATRVRDLLDSLYRGYPSGSILLWETDHSVPTQSMGVAQEAGAIQRKLLLLDGQQRLTSLAAVVRGAPVEVRGRRKPIDILFNLEHPDGGPTDVVDIEDDDAADVERDSEDEDESPAGQLQERLNQKTFVVANRAMAAMPNWVRVSDVFKSEDDAEFFEKAGVTGFKDPRYKKYQARLSRLRAIRRYHYTVNTLESTYSYEEVAEIFVRVNSLGVKLRAADLAMAQVTARWPNSLTVFEAFQEKLEEDHWTFDLGFLLRMAVVFATKQSRFKTIGGIPIERIKAGWEQAKLGLHFACNFLKTRAGIEEETVLSSLFLVPPIAVYSQLKREQLSEREQADLLRWVYVANMRAWYSNSAETALDEDLGILFRGGSPADLTQRIEQNFGRVEVRAADLAGKGQRNPLFSMAFLALRARGARDWHTGVGISLVLSGKNHFIEWHHIMPKALLKGAGYENAAINEIANMAFIGGTTNRRIGKRQPHEYLAELVEKHGESFLHQHAIPADRSLWSIERFPDFLAARRELIAQAINELVGRTHATDGQRATA
jgi:hypothetical protein